MKFFIATPILAGIAAAVPAPAPQSDPVRVLPPLWQFTILSQKGPGCEPVGERRSQLTFGSNTMDGSEIYHWYIAYPSMSASIGPGIEKFKEHTWCDTTLSYTEWSDIQGMIPASNYRLRLNKNGTDMFARYNLEEDVTAKWKFQYFIGDEEWSNDIAIKGPVALEKQISAREDHSQKGALHPLEACGTGIFRLRTDIWLTAGNEKAKGQVIADRFDEGGTKKEFPYGVEQGFSYDWEKCKK